MTSPDLAEARGLCSYIDASPSPFHCVETTAKALAETGFQRLEELEAWNAESGRFYVERAGSIVAWALPAHLPTTMVNYC